MCGLEADEDTKDQPHSLIHNHNYSGFTLRIGTRGAPENVSTPPS